MMKRRIVHLTSVHPALDIRIFHKECKSLSRAGYEVTLVAPHEADPLVDGVRIKAVPRPPGRRSRMTRTVLQLYREAVRLDAGVYHFHDPELIPVGLLLRAQGKKVIYDIHEDVPRDILSKYYLPRWVRRPLAWLAERIENVASGRFSAVVPATPAIAARFATINGNTTLVQNFPTLGELSSQTRVAWGQRECSVAYVGGITEDRGIRQMVKAMSLLPVGLSATLKVVGTFSPTSLREEIRHEPGWNRVEELGFLDRMGVKAILESVRAGLVPFHPMANYVRAQPNKLFEYMSAGIPVIASDFPLWREIIQGARCGLLVDPLDVKAIAGAIEHILLYPQEAEAMGNRGREMAERQYNWGTEERRLLQLYASLWGCTCVA